MKMIKHSVSVMGSVATADRGPDASVDQLWSGSLAAPRVAIADATDFRAGVVRCRILALIHQHDLSM